MMRFMIRPAAQYSLLLMLVLAALSCGDDQRQAWQITRILQQRCQQSADQDEHCEHAAKQRQRLPAILQTTSSDQVFLSIADPNNGEDLSYQGKRRENTLHFVAQQQRHDPDTDCRYNRVDTIDLRVDGDLIEGEQQLRVEQSGACTTTGWSLLTRQVWLWRGHRLVQPQAPDAASAKGR